MSGPQDQAERAPDRLKEMLRYLDGVASAAEVAQLAAGLRASPADRREVARLLLQIGALEDSLDHRAAGRAPQPLATVPLRRRRSHRLAWIAAGVATAALVALFALVRAPERPAPVAEAPPAPSTPPRIRRPPVAPGLPPQLRPRVVARVAAQAGTAFATGEGWRQGLAVGAALGDGNGVELGGGSQARVALALADGVRLELRGEGLISALSAEHAGGQEARVRVSLERGTAVATVPARPPEGTSLFVTPLAEIRLRAGEVKLEIEAEVTRVRVRAGAAEVRRLSDDQRFVLEAGQGVLVSEARALGATEGPRALLVRGSDGRGVELDRLITARLEAEGFAVRGVDEAVLSASDFGDKALVVISSSSAGQVLAARLPATGLRELAVPVVNCESFAFVPLGMATRQGVGPGITQVFIEQPAHPLAAGKTGEVRIASAAVGATWALPTSSAVGVGTLYGRRRVAVFGYERGAAMVGATAPARRVSCFLDTRRLGALTEDAWELFDAAVRWAAEP